MISWWQSLGLSGLSFVFPPWEHFWSALAGDSMFWSSPSHISPCVWGGGREPFKGTQLFTYIWEQSTRKNPFSMPGKGGGGRREKMTNFLHIPKPTLTGCSATCQAPGIHTQSTPQLLWNKSKFQGERVGRLRRRVHYCARNHKHRHLKRSS